MERRIEALKVWKKEKVDMALEERKVMRMEGPWEEKEEMQQLPFVVDLHANRHGGREF